MKKLLCTFYFFLSCLLSFGQRTNYIVKKGVHVTISAEKDSYKIGDSIIISITNISAETICFWEGSLPTNCIIFQKLTGGKWLQAIWRCPTDTSKWTKTTFQPGEIKTLKHTNISQKGVYRFTFRYYYKKCDRRGWRNPLTGNAYARIWEAYSKEFTVK